MEIKTMVIILALCIALSIPDMAFVPNEATPENTTGDGSVEAVSAYGYIDLEADTITTEPDAPEKQMERMEEPVKILFAAFEGNIKAVMSPEFAD